MPDRSGVRVSKGSWRLLPPVPASDIVRRSTHDWRELMGENLDTVKEMYEAFGRADVEAILARVADDVDWAVDTSSTVAPWYGPRTGRDGVASYFRDIAGASEVLEFTPLSFAANDDDVHTLVRYRVRLTSTGRETEMNLHHFFRFRDGKVAYVRASEDTAQTVEALGG
jgi:ketosteroid isomerase-like protein